MDDAPFSVNQEYVRLIGVIFRNPLIDNVLSCMIKKDGTDSTEKITELVLSSRSKNQIGVIMLDGINFAGINIVDIFKISEDISLPVISVVRKMPDPESFELALSSEKKGKEERLRIFRKYKPPVKFRNIYYHSAGIPPKKAEEIIKLSTIRSRIPEPVRIAHLIGAGIVKGESRGRV